MAEEEEELQILSIDVTHSFNFSFRILDLFLLPSLCPPPTHISEWTSLVLWLGRWKRRCVMATPKVKA